MSKYAPSSSSKKEELPLRLLLTSLFSAAVLLRLLLTSQPGSSTDALFALAFSLLSLFLWKTRDVSHEDSEVSVLGPLERLAVLWALLALFSLAWSWHPAQSFRALAVVLSPVAVVIGLRALQCSEHLRVLYAVAIGGGIQALNGLFQVFVQWPDALLRRHELQLPPSIVQRMETGRPIGMSLSPDLFGALCFAGSCAAFTLFLYRRAKLRREGCARRELVGLHDSSLELESPSLLAGFFWVFLAVLSLFGVVASRSVGTFVAVGVAFSLFVLWSAQFQSRKKAVGALVFLLGVGGVGLGLVLYLRGAEALAHSLQERWLNWSVATRILEQNPLGVGLDRFAPAYLQWRSPEGNVTRFAHSLWMQGAAELGFGFVFLAFGGLVVVGKQLRIRVPKLSAPCAFLLAGVVGWTLRASLDYDLQIAQTSTGWATLVGLAFFWTPAFFVEKGPSTASILDENRPIDVEQPSLGVSKSPPRFATGYLLGSVFLSAAVFWQCSSLEDMRTSAQKTSLVENAFLKPCENALAVPAVGMLFYSPCESSECPKRHTQLTSLLNAALSCPHPSAMLWRVQAMISLSQGDDVKTEKALDEALRIDPGNLVGHQLRIKAAEAVIDVDRLRLRRREARRWFSEETLGRQSWQLERPSAR